MEIRKPNQEIRKYLNITALTNSQLFCHLLIYLFFQNKTPFPFLPEAHIDEPFLNKILFGGLFWMTYLSNGWGG